MVSKLPFILILSLSYSAMMLSVRAEPIATSGSREIALLELFTSEGCSSCPPAEKWMSGLKDHPGLWTEFVPVVFHVDYWDGLGWKDPYASAQFTARQRLYAAHWGSSTVYTPGFVLDGKEVRGRPKIGEVGKKKAGHLTLHQKDPVTFAVDFTPLRGFGGGTAHVAFLGTGLLSDVRRGENAGRKLEHDFTVLEYATKRLQKSGESWIAEITQGESRQVTAIAAWVVKDGSIDPIQATGNWLALEAHKRAKN